jgi:WD40 repeat protein
VEEPEPVPVIPISLSFDRSVKVKAPNDEMQFLKAPRVIYKGHGLSVHCVAVFVTPNDDNSLIFSGGDDKIINAWSLRTGDKVAEFRGHLQRITSISVFQSVGYAPLIVSGSWDEKLRIWPIDECLQHNQEPQGNNSLNQLSERLSSRSIILKGHINRIFEVKVIHSVGEEPVVASGSSDNTIRVWSLPQGLLLYVLEDERDDTWNLCLSSWYIADRPGQTFHGTMIISGCKNSTVRVWRHKTSVKAVTAAVAGQPAAAPARKTRTSPTLVIRGHTSAVHSLAPFDYMDRPYLVTACKDAELRVWSLLTGIITLLLRNNNVGHFCLFYLLPLFY